MIALAHLNYILHLNHNPLHCASVHAIEVYLSCRCKFHCKRITSYRDISSINTTYKVNVGGETVTTDINMNRNSRYLFQVHFCDIASDSYFSYYGI